MGWGRNPRYDSRGGLVWRVAGGGMPSLLIVEDDPIVGASLQAELERAGFVVHWARGYEDGWRLLLGEEPALVLLDLSLPDGSGLDLLGRIRERSQVPVIVVTGHGLAEEKVHGLDLGADDYVTKPFWTDELLARVRARLRVAPPQRQSLRFKLGRVVLDLAARALVVQGRARPLTPAEHALLSCLVARPGAAVRREELLIRLAAEGCEASDPAVQTHMSRLRGKLGPEAGRLSAVWGIGYRLEVDPDGP